MTGTSASPVRTEDDLRLALLALEERAPSVESVLRGLPGPAGHQVPRRPWLARPAARASRPRRLGLAATAAAAAAAVALAVAIHQPGAQPGTHPGGRAGGSSPARLAAWTVRHDPDGTIRITIRELRDPTGLQDRLRAAGVPANVVFLRHDFTPTTSTSAIPRACRPPRMSDAANAQLQEKIMPFPGPGMMAPGRAVLIIRPSAIPSGIGLFIEAWAARSGLRSGTLFDLQTDLVQASRPCTGS
jgi:hypothetical protein